MKDVNDFVAYHSIKTHAVPTNFFNVTSTEFFLYNSIQGGVGVDEVSGKPDVVSMLYTDEGVDQYVTYPGTQVNGYGVLSNAVNDFPGDTDTIKMIAPTGIKQGLNVEPGGIVMVGDLGG